ncbi:MAG: RnfABCDGE type electron transport complex subunit D, partial [Pseudomonadota bacterium]
MSSQQLQASPYAHAGIAVNGIMLQVCFALLPATLFGFYLYGWPAIFLFIVTIVAAIVTEILSLHWLKQPWYRV